MAYVWAEDNGFTPLDVEILGLSNPISGKKYVMYHGTTWQAAQGIMKNGFRQSSGGMLGPGVYLSRDLNKASRYPIECPEGDRVVIRVVVRVGKVIAINYQGHPQQYTWHDAGYDTAWVPPDCGMVKSGLEKNCVWDPERIKITKQINPVRISFGFGKARQGKASDSDTSMAYQWAEDDFDLPSDVEKLGMSNPISGKKYVMYHGTTREAAQGIMQNGFRQSSAGMLGPGVYLSRELEKASRYPIDCPEGDRVVIKAVVRVGKVIIINKQHHPQQYTWHDAGYDTAWVPPDCGMVKSGLEENCVWDPERIKITKQINPVQTSFGSGARGFY